MNRASSHRLKNVVCNCSICILAVWSIVWAGDTRLLHSLYICKLRLDIEKHIELCVCFVFPPPSLKLSILRRRTTEMSSRGTERVLESVEHSERTRSSPCDCEKEGATCAKAPSDPSAAIYRTGMKALAVPWQNSFPPQFFSLLFSLEEP